MRNVIFILLFPVFLIATQAIVVDPYFSPFSGGYNIRFTHKLLMELDDYSSDAPPQSATRAAWRRFFELQLWSVINGMADVAQHEVFGHGYRLRELGISPDKYEVTPWSGYTAFDLPSSFPIGDLMAVDVAGLEAEAILAHQMKMNWMQSGKIDGRESTLYNRSEQSVFWYTLITALGRLKEDEPVPGNDVESYLYLMNSSYEGHAMTIGKLTRWSLLTWVNPMIFYNIYAWFYYIAIGEAWSFPMIDLSQDVRYLPNLRVGYAPFAPEGYFENYFSIHGRPLYAYVKGGPRSLGAGFECDRVLGGDQASLGLRLDGWRQNRFVSNATVEDLEEGLSIKRAELNEKIWGIGGTVTGKYAITPRVALFVEAGGKTSGYLPGFQLGGGAVGRLGIVINPEFAKKCEGMR